LYKINFFYLFFLDDFKGESTTNDLPTTPGKEIFSELGEFLNPLVDEAAEASNNLTKLLAKEDGE
jgi:hypothetical protein